MATQSRSIVIIGGGISGSTTAYFLTRHPTYNAVHHKITILEASSIAGGASGKAGGLVALWAYPECIVPLSFRLHDELARLHGGDERWGYRRVKVGNVSAVISPRRANGHGEKVSLGKRKTAATAAAKGMPKDLDWLDNECVKGYSEMGDESTTAQVHPYLFTTSMVDLATEKGAEVVIGSATGIVHGTEGVTGVKYTSKDGKEKLIPATDVVIAAGPWTRNVWPTAPISALRAHSVTIRPSKPISAYAIFTDIKMANGKRAGPEIYARPNNEAYACGEGDTLIELPSTSSEVETDLKRCQDIVDQVGSISEELRDGEVLVRQACYLPNVEGPVSGPLIGPTGVKGVFMAAGHTCWGISNSCATGKLMSEFIFDGRASSANIKSLDPRQVL